VIEELKVYREYKETLDLKVHKAIQEQDPREFKATLVLKAHKESAPRELKELEDIKEMMGHIHHQKI
jgi:hypothetical protein